MIDTRGLEKVIEIVKRPHPDVSDEHMEDIIAISNQAAADLAALCSELAAKQAVIDEARKAFQSICMGKRFHIECGYCAQSSAISDKWLSANPEVEK